MAAPRSSVIDPEALEFMEQYNALQKQELTSQRKMRQAQMLQAMGEHELGGMLAAKASRMGGGKGAISSKDILGMLYKEADARADAGDDIPDWVMGVLPPGLGRLVKDRAAQRARELAPRRKAIEASEIAIAGEEQKAAYHAMESGQASGATEVLVGGRPQTSITGAGTQQAGAMGRLQATETLADTFPTSAALAIGPEAFRAATGRKEAIQKEAEFKAMMPVKQLEAETAMINASVAKAKADLLPEELRVKALELGNQLQISQNQLAQSRISGRTAELAHSTAAMANTIKKLELAVEQETNALSKQILSQHLSNAQSTMQAAISGVEEGQPPPRTEEREVTYGISGGKPTITSKPKEYEAKRDAVAKEFFGVPTNKLSQAEISVVNDVALKRERSVVAAAQPLPAEMANRLAASNFAMRVGNDIHALFSPETLGPVQQWGTSFKQLQGWTDSKTNQFIQGINRFKKLMVYADTGLTLNEKEIKDAGYQFPDVNQNPKVAYDQLVASMRQLTQRRESILEVARATRGESSPAEMIQPAMNIGLPSSGTTTMPGATNATPEQAAQKYKALSSIQQEQLKQRAAQSIPNYDALPPDQKKDAFERAMLQLLQGAP